MKYYWITLTNYINDSDIVAIVNYILGDRDIYVDLADTYCDDAIDVKDVMAVVNYVLGTPYPVVEPVYTVIGTPNLFEAEWDPTYDKNDMVKGSDGRYHLRTGGYFKEGAEIYFKVVRNHNITRSWPSENRPIYIAETGAWDIEIIFDPNATDDEMFTIDINKLY